MIHHDKEVGLICVTERETCLQVMIDHTLIVHANTASLQQRDRAWKSNIWVQINDSEDGQWEKTYSKLSVMASINPQMELRESLFAFCTRRPCLYVKDMFLKKIVTGLGCEASQQICRDSAVRVTPHFYY